MFRTVRHTTIHITSVLFCPACLLFWLFLLDFFTTGFGLGGNKYFSSQHLVVLYHPFSTCLSARLWPNFSAPQERKLNGKTEENFQNIFFCQNQRTKCSCSLKKMWQGNVIEYLYGKIFCSTLVKFCMMKTISCLQYIFSFNFREQINMEV